MGWWGCRHAHIFELGQALFCLSQAEKRKHDKSILCWLRKKILVDTSHRYPGFSLWDKSLYVRDELSQPAFVGDRRGKKQEYSEGEGLCHKASAHPIESSEIELSRMAWPLSSSPFGCSDYIKQSHGVICPVEGKYNRPILICIPC